MYESIVANVKTKQEITVDTDDAMLALYARDAVNTVNDIRAFSPTPDEPYERKYEGIIEEMVIERYNRRGVEGEVSSSANGVSRTYASTSYSPDLLANITPVVLVY